MKRKIISSLLALAVVAGAIVPVSAASTNVNSVGSVKEDITNNPVEGQDTTQSQQSEYHDKITEDKEQATNVYATVASEFEVVIPKTVILGGDTKKGYYTVDVNGDIAGDEKVTVVPDASAAMEQEGKDDVTATITQDKTEWIFDEMDTNALGTIDAQNLSAGSWNGTFNFAITLETGTTEPPTTCEHNYENFRCTLCNELDPTHTTHEYTNNDRCICGELNPDHVHEYTEGTCICGATETPVEG